MCNSICNRNIPQKNLFMKKTIKNHCITRSKKIIIKKDFGFSIPKLKTLKEVMYYSTKITASSKSDFTHTSILIFSN